MQPEETSYTIQLATEDKFHNYYTIQYGLGWDPFYKCQELIIATDTNGCFFGKINGKIVSSISAMKYSKYGFIGVYWVKDEYRGKGYGLQIFKKGMEYLKDCSVIGLDAVTAQVTNYERSGFKSHSHSLKGYAISGPESYIPINSLIVMEKNEINIDQIGEFDSQYFPTNRTNFLKKAIELGEIIVSYDPQTKKIRGYGVVNKLQSGVALAPFIAQSPEIAEDIIQIMFQRVQSECYVLFYSDEHQHVSNLAKKYFPYFMYSCKRMYYLGPSFTEHFDTKNIYGLTGYERG